MLGKSWKTSLGGIGMLLTAAAQIATSFANGTMPSWETVIPTILAGISLLFAKDSGVTGK